MFDWFYKDQNLPGRPPIDIFIDEGWLEDVIVQLQQKLAA